MLKKPLLTVLALVLIAAPGFGSVAPTITGSNSAVKFPATEQNPGAAISTKASTVSKGFFSIKHP